jgi:uncharacterized membrane protein
MSKAKQWNDTDMELYLSRLMRYGIVLASAIVVTGCVMFLAKSGSARPQYSQFTGEPEQFTSVSGIVASISTGNGRGLIQFGLLVLISIPVLRVAFSVVSFVIEKNRIYVLITLVVLALLLFSLLGQQ